MPELIVTMGVPGCGKSTWIRSQTKFVQTDAMIVCPDEIRRELTGDINNQTVNDEVFRLAHERAKEWMRSYQDVYFDATNVTGRARTELLKLAKYCSIPTRLVVFDNVPQAMVRNAERDRVVPADVMRRMVIQFVESLHDIGIEGWDIIEFKREF